MKPEEVKVGNCIGIMKINISDVKATAYGVVVKISGATQNGINLSKNIFLFNVTELFDSMLLVHIPLMSSGRRCKCSHKDHRLMKSFCNVNTLKYFVRVTFHVIETAYRFQKVDAVDSTANPVEHILVETAK